MHYVPPPHVTPWCPRPDCPLSLPGLISATTHLFYPLLTSFIRSSAACDRLCLVSCVPVHISKFPCLYHPLPPSGKCSFCRQVAATRGQQSPMELGKTWLVAFLLLPRLLPAPTTTPSLWASPRQLLQGGPTSRSETCCLHRGFLERSVRAGVSKPITHSFQ